MGKIYCIEGEWERSHTDRRSVVPTLELLERLEIAGHRHRFLATREELEYQLSRFDRRSFDVLYLASHGSAGTLHIRDDLQIGLEELAELLQDRLHDRDVYLGGCDIARCDDSELKAFVETSGARLLVGYSQSVDWLDSAAFDLIVLSRLIDYRRADATFRRLVQHNESQAIAFGLTVATRRTVHRAQSLDIVVND